ncbi:MAG TPA: class I SAM-dependent methyltransferase [Steroidobacteraceae bacterium]|nr:class I SAM-dependent methyltransferase [Steroidobacteraceae bacterium]
MEFAEYLRDIPRFHSWDGGVTWNSGGFSPGALKTLHGFLHARLPPRPTLLETGAGNSTVMMLFLSPAKIISIEPDAQLFERIRQFCELNAISYDALESHPEGSQWVLPQLAADNRRFEPLLDFALIDGCHGWPTCLVDLGYAHAMLKPGGYLLIDDTQLHSVKEMARFLTEQPGFCLALDLGKSLVFQKLTAERDFGEWERQPYIVRRTQQYLRSPNRYALLDDSLFARTADIFVRGPLAGLRAPLLWVGRRLPQQLGQRLKKSSWYRRLFEGVHGCRPE